MPRGPAFFLLAAALALGGRGAARALPQYQRLFQAKYKYRPNCLACHVRDNWELTRYGVDFFKRGRSLEAFAAIEASDPDEDGVASGPEIAARSNPGDPRSTPAKLGDWLENLRPVAPPAKHLKALFPRATRFGLREGELGAAARRRVEATLGRGLRDEALYPVLFEAYEGERRLGAALYGSTRGRQPCFFLAGYSKPPAKGAPRVLGLRMLLCPMHAMRDPDFLVQFAGRSPDALASVRPPLEAYAETTRDLVVAVEDGAFVLEELLR